MILTYWSTVRRSRNQTHRFPLLPPVGCLATYDLAGLRRNQTEPEKFNHMTTPSSESILARRIKDNPPYPGTVVGRVIPNAPFSALRRTGARPPCLRNLVGRVIPNAPSVNRGGLGTRPSHKATAGAVIRPTSFRFALAASLLALALTASAQEVVAPRPAEELVPPALQQERAAQGILPMSIAPTFVADTRLLEWGPAVLRAHLSYSYLNGDGIPSAPGQNLTTAIHTITPEFLVDVGTRWMVDYTPSWTFYSNSAFTDTVSQSVRAVGATSYEDWGFNVAQSYSLSTSPLVETGRQTKEEDVGTNLGATWQMNSKLALELTGTQNLRYVWAQPDSFEWSTIDWLHYKAAPGLDTAIGLGYGYVNMTEGPDMTYGRYLGRIGFRVTDKINLNLQGGLETRKFKGAGVGAMNNGTYDASIQYHPMEATILSFSANRGVTASYFASQVTRNSGVGATLQQRFLGLLYLSVGVQHGTSNYLPSAAGVVAGRDDTYDSVNLRLSTTFRRRGTVAAIYQHSRNSSNTTGFGLTSSQYGIEVAWRF